MSSTPKDTPSGNLPPLLPNQIERLELNLEQMRCLSSTIRADVFWSFHAIDQKSVSDVATEVGKSAQTVHYHVNALVKIGLIVPGETRKRRSRIEQLYVRKARSSLDPSIGATEIYNRYRHRAFKLETQRMAAEDSHFWGMMERDSDIINFAAFRKYRLMLTKERASKLRWDLVTLLMDAVADHTPASEGGIQVNSIIYMRPTVFQLKKWAAEAGIPFKELSRDGIPDEVEENDES